MKIVRAERIALNIPFYADRVTRAMQRASSHVERVYVYRFISDRGVVGYGDCQGGRSEVANLVGRNPFEIMHDDSIGLGPQIAAFDLAGKIAGVPVHALLGSKLRNFSPMSWWDIDMPRGDWAAEAKESIRRGYTCFKMKARPWRDIVDQVSTVGRVVTPDYKFDVDFNGFLLNQARAELILHRLDEHPNVGIYESPFYLGHDLAGARILRERVRKPIVEHFNEAVLHAHASDGFVIGSGATEVRRQATLAAAFNKVFWLQMVGAGITAAYAVHLGATLSHAQLPYITCHELWQHDLLAQRLQVVNGYVAVPDAPGLGVEVDEKVIEKYRVDENDPTPTTRYKARKRILRISWPASGKQRRVWEFTSELVYQQTFYRGSIPSFEPGVNLEIIEDDKSPAFKKAHQKLVEQGA